MQHESSHRRGFVAIDGLGCGDEAHAVTIQRLHIGDDVVQGAPEAIKLPNQDGRELLTHGGIHQGIERRARFLRSAYSGIDVFLNDLKSVLSAILAQFTELHFTVLIARADACI